MVRLFLLAVILLAAAAGGAAYWLLVRDDDSAEADVQVVRWGNVTIQVSEESGVLADRTFVPAQIKPPDGGPALILRKGDSLLVIDADTGKVLEDFVGDGDKAAIQEAADSLKVSELDKENATWPYSDPAPDAPREQTANVTFVPPDPASGIIVRKMVNDPGGWGLIVTNGRSTLTIDAETGDIIEENTLILPEDKEAFDRFLSAAEYIGPSP